MVPKKQFEVKDYHLKLLKKSYTSWDSMESGAPSIDPKRPYGSKLVEEDIAEVLGKKDELFDDGGWRTGEREEYEELYEIHEEMEIVLSILLDHPTDGIEEGTYKKENYGDDWKKVDS